MDNIYLIGMMGSGKTTIGIHLAHKLKRNFIDIDNDIELINQMSISDIFNHFGEPKFREMESAYFIEKSKKGGAVFSTGGGIVLKKENREILKNNGMTFLLDLDYKILSDRLKDCNDRPILSQLGSDQSLQDIWAIRKKLYYESCHHIINIENISISEVASQIIEIAS